MTRLVGETADGTPLEAVGDLRSIFEVRDGDEKREHVLVPGTPFVVWSEDTQAGTHCRIRVLRDGRRDEETESAVMKAFALEPTTARTYHAIGRWLQQRAAQEARP